MRIRRSGRTSASRGASRSATERSGRIVRPTKPELARILVDPALRRRGIGRRLTALLGERARAAGFVDVWLRVVPDNEPALAAYRAAGFVAGVAGGRGELQRRPTLRVRLDEARRRLRASDTNASLEVTNGRGMGRRPMCPPSTRSPTIARDRQAEPVTAPVTSPSLGLRRSAPPHADPPPASPPGEDGGDGEDEEQHADHDARHAGAATAAAVPDDRERPCSEDRGAAERSAQASQVTTAS